MDIIIGRDKATSKLKLAVGGKDLLFGDAGSVPASVSEQHCTLTMTAKGMRLQNINADNDTYVNGRSIVSKGVSEADQVELGAAHYLLDWKILQPIAPINIAPLATVWNNYDSQNLELQISERRFNTLRSITGLFTMAAIVLGLLTGRQSPWLMVLYVAAILVSLAFFVLAMRNASAIPQKKQQLSRQFQRDYVCPKCGHFLGNQPYELLLQNDGCPYCKTHFIH